VNPRKSGALVPPRPNLGPEPWAETRPWGADLPALAVLMALAITVIGAGWRLRRLRARGRHAPRMSVSAAAPTGELASRRERLIALSRAVREALVARFGPAWRSKTTEEIAREADLAAAFGPEDAARLLRFLQDADRAKFADEGEPSWTPPPDHDPEEAWVEEFLASAGAHPEPSRRKGGGNGDRSRR
jgi:hypothetical protein